MLGEILKDYRRRNNYSQRDLAEILGVSVRSVGRWEQGKAKPSTEELLKLSKVIGISELELIREDDSVSVPNNNVLDRISDGVDNLVTGQDTINESIIAGNEEYRERQKELIRELKDQNSELMKKLEESQNTNELQNEIIRQKRIRNYILFGFAVLLLTIIVLFIWITVSYGPITADQPEVYAIDIEED